MANIDIPSETERVSPPKKRRSMWRVIGWFFLVVLLLTLIAAAYVWTNRYALIEDYVQDILSDQGVEADLSIVGISKTSANLKDVDIRADGQSVFSVEGLSVDYDWREALEGKIKKLELIGPTLSLTVDGTGKITDGWLPVTDAQGGQGILPKEGVFLRRAKLRLKTPYGPIQAKGDITIKDRDTISADMTMLGTVLTKEEALLELSGPLSGSLSQGVAALDFNLQLPKARYGERRLQTASLEGRVTTDINAALNTIESDIALKFESLKTRRFETQAGEARWAGLLTLGNEGEGPQASGDWALSVDAISLSDDALGQALASQLSLSETLSVTPIAESFSLGLKEMVSTLLQRANLSGQGALSYNDDRVQIELSDRVNLGSQANKMTLSPSRGAALYDFDRKKQRLSVQASVSVRGLYPMEIEALNLTTQSPDGIAVEQVETLSATLKRDAPWKAKAAGRDVTLGAGKLALSYQAGASRRLSVRGPLEFDGPLPGSWVKGLKTAGALDVTLTDNAMLANYTPFNGRPIELESVETTTAWQAENLTFNLGRREAPLYARYQDSSETAAQLLNVQGVVRETQSNKALSIAFSGLDVSGVMKPDVQDWQIEADTAEVKTDDYIGENVLMRTPRANLTVRMADNQPIDLSLQTLSASVTTPLLEAKNIPLSLNGTPERFEINYGSEARKGRIALKDGSLPPLPLMGALVFEDGAFTGAAQTVLPKAEETEINVSYVFKDGAGTAKVTIPELNFERGKLQPQDLAKAFQGKIADVNGTVAATIDLAFKAGEPLQSSGRARLRNLDFGTLPGPFNGVSTDIEFDSVFPLVTLGRQRLTVKSFNPGLALDDGIIEYELVDGGVKIHSAVWPLVNGTIEIEPTLWSYNAERNRVVLTINGVSVGAFLGDIGGGNLTATGDVTGTIPVLVEGVTVSIEGGVMSVKDGGIIQYRSPPLISPVDFIPNEFVTLKDYQQFQDMRKNPDPESNPGKDLAFTALRNFEYKSLSAKLNGPLDGEVEVNLKFEGRNPKILAGTRFAFNVTVIGELVNLARNLKIDGSFDKIRGYLDLNEAENGPPLEP